MSRSFVDELHFSLSRDDYFKHDHDVRSVGRLMLTDLSQVLGARVEYLVAGIYAAIFSGIIFLI